MSGMNVNVSGKCRRRAQALADRQTDGRTLSRCSGANLSEADRRRRPPSLVRLSLGSKAADPFGPITHIHWAGAPPPRPNPTGGSSRGGYILATATATTAPPIVSQFKVDFESSRLTASHVAGSTNFRPARQVSAKVPLLQRPHWRHCSGSGSGSGVDGIGIGIGKLPCGAARAQWRDSDGATFTSPAPHGARVLPTAPSRSQSLCSADFGGIESKATQKRLRGAHFRSVRRSIAHSLAGWLPLPLPLPLPVPARTRRQPSTYFHFFRRHLAPLPPAARFVFAARLVEVSYGVAIAVTRHRL